MTTAPAFYFCTGCQDYFTQDHFSGQRSAVDWDDDDLDGAAAPIDRINDEIAGFGSGSESCSNCGGTLSPGEVCACAYLQARRLNRLGADIGGFRRAAQKAGGNPVTFWYYQDPLLASRQMLRRLAPKPRDGAEALDRIWARAMPPR